MRGESLLPPLVGARGERWVFAVLSLGGLVLSFGPALYLDIYRQAPTGLPLPYAWLYQAVPGFDALRVPTRFGELFMLGLAVCAGYGIADCGLRIAERAKSESKIQNPKSKIVLGLVLLLIAAEYWTTGWPATPTPTGGAAPPVYRWLAAPATARVIPPDALLLELPIGGGDQPINTNPIDLLYGLVHGHPLLNGSANIIPPGYDRLFYEIRRFPSQNTLDLAVGLGAQYLVVHTGDLSAANAAALLALAAPGGRLDTLASFPDSPAAPAATVMVYRVHPAPERFATLATALPSGADVLLADHPGHRRLTTAVLPRLLGSDRHYFITYDTVYNRLMPNLQPAQPGHVYPYAVFYADPDGAAEPAKYGYSPADRVVVSADGLLAVYHHTSK